MSSFQRLPVHGFVLAGGKSSRMGQDKATLNFKGQPLVELAVARLRSFCLEVSVAGNRDDLARFAPVVHESRPGEGPVAGIEAGLLQARHPWALFTPVDVPLAPASLLNAWVGSVLGRAASGVRLSYLEVQGERQPAFCLLHKDVAGAFTAVVDSGERRVSAALHSVAATLGRQSLWRAAAETIVPGTWNADALRRSFANLNTPEELHSAQVAAVESTDAN